MIKKILSIFLSIALFFSISIVYTLADTDLPPEDESTSAGAQPNLELNVKSCILMEPVTGTILYEMDADTALPPASVTKVMTMLLTFEALDRGNIHKDDQVSISAYASSMGGSQVFLAEGETMSIHDLLKCMIIASANDAAVAIAEHIAGSETAFVDLMNARAQELGMKNTHFENVTGLDDDTTNHVLSAKDIAIATKELYKYPSVFEYSSVWMDTIRDGAFTLSNTNRLIRYYNGATGLKTGSTDKAGFCISATASRNGMDLIAVVMGAPTRDARNEAAKTLFDWGFANYTRYHVDAQNEGSVPVKHGLVESVSGVSVGIDLIVPKSEASKIERIISLQTEVEAPIKKGTEIGTVTYYLDGELVGTAPIYAEQDIGAVSFWELFIRLLKIFTLA